MSFKSISLAVATFALSANAYSATVSYSGYSLDTNTNIITDGDIEWLRWDQTIGMSIDQALSAYSADGWRVASNIEVATLFNSFALQPSITFDTDEV